MKSQKKSLKKVITLALAVVCFGAVSLTGCAEDKSVSNVDVEQMYIDKSRELSIDWNTIVSNLKEYDLKDTGFYIDKEYVGEEAENFFTVTFTNYDPTVSDSFKKVDNQIMVSYGIATKNNFAYETPEFYNEPVYEITINSNNSDEYYFACYSETKELLSEEGEWLLNTDRDKTVSNYIDICSDAMGV